MKKTNLFLWALIVGPMLHAQQDVAASGGDAAGSGGSASYSAGQVVYTTISGAGGTATQGVQQPYEIYVLGNDDLDTIQLVAVVYPNPTVSTVQLQIVNAELTGFQYRLFDLNGRIITSGTITQVETTIEMERYPAATYLLQVYSETKKLKTFKIIKNDI
jgi:hypothetical protein